MTQSRYFLRYAGKGRDFAELYEVVDRASGNPTGPAQPRVVAEKNLEAMESLIKERAALTGVEPTIMQVRCDCHRLVVGEDGNGYWEPAPEA